MKTNLLLAALAALAFLAAPSCAVVAAAGLGIAISQEFTDNAHSLRLEGNLEETWRATIATLDALSLDPVQVDEKERVLQAIVRGSQVTAHVSAHDQLETVLAVTAKSYGRYQTELAEEILFRVRERMAR